MFDALSPEAGPAGHPASSLSDEDLHREILTLAGHIAAAKCAWLDLVAEMDRRAMYYEWGCKSAADWLSVRCGIGLGTAFEYVRVARAMSEFPLIHDAFATGEFSYSKVRAVTRVATPANEETLVDYARYATGAQLEKIVGAFRGAREAADPERVARRLARRYLRFHFDADGSLVGSFRLPPETGATLVAAIEAARAELEADERGGSPVEPQGEPAGTGEPSPAGDTAGQECPGGSFAGESSAEESDPADSPAGDTSSAGDTASAGDTSSAGDTAGQERPGGSFGPIVIADDPEPASWRNADEPHGARMVDALVHMAETALSKMSQTGSVMPAPSIIVHVDGSSITIDDGPHVGFETALRLACDGSVATQWMVDGLPVDLGRTKRVVSPALRRTLHVRDGGCVFPGCHRKRFTQAHHLIHWADGGPTDLDNLATFCSWHHHLVHEGGFTVSRCEDGKLTFYNAKGEDIADRCAGLAGSQRRLREWNAADGVTITPDTCVPLGGGEPYDLSIAVDGLMWCEPTEVRGY